MTMIIVMAFGILSLALMEVAYQHSLDMQNKARMKKFKRN